MRPVIIRAAAAIVMSLGILVVSSCSSGGGSPGPAANAQNTNTVAANAVNTGASPSASAVEDLPSPFASVFANSEANSEQELYADSWVDRLLLIFERLLMAVFFSAVLAFRPRHDVPLFRRSLFVSQTQILLAVVAAALMMIVGDNTARAFAIFAAVSLVRFRTNIRDPKEITVLLISLALGLAAGVGRFELGLALCIFALALLWMLEYNESEQIVRSMEIAVKTRNTEKTQKQLKKLFKKLRLASEVRSIDPPDSEKEIGTIAYYINLPLNLTTDELSDRIMKKDSDNIEHIQWSKTKSAGNIFK